MILMTPGPVTPSERVMAALSEPMLFHRYPDFETLYKETCDKLMACFHASPKHDCVIFSGSGSLANEIVLSSGFKPGTTVVVPANGTFGQRLANQLAAHDIRVEVLDFGMFNPIDVDAVETAVRRMSAAGVAMVAMETSTGMLNPVGEVAHAIGLCAEHLAHRPALVVDAVSALGVEDVDVSAHDVAYCTSVPNKAIGAVPGISFACIDRDVYSRDARPQQGSYLDLESYLRFASRAQTPTTPAIPQIKALGIALDELVQEGIAARRERCVRLSKLLVEGLQASGFHPVIDEPASRASAVTVFAVPNPIDTASLRMQLQHDGFVVWFPPHDTYRDQRLMIVSVMGSIGETDVHAFLESMKRHTR